MAYLFQILFKFDAIANSEIPPSVDFLRQNTMQFLNGGYALLLKFRSQFIQIEFLQHLLQLILDLDVTKMAFSAFGQS